MIIAVFEPLESHTQLMCVVRCDEEDRTIVRPSAVVVASREHSYQMPAVHHLKPLSHELVRPNDKAQIVAPTKLDGHVARKLYDARTALAG